MGENVASSLQAVFLTYRKPLADMKSAMVFFGAAALSARTLRSAGSGTAAEHSGPVAA